MQDADAHAFFLLTSEWSSMRLGATRGFRRDVSPGRELDPDDHRRTRRNRRARYFSVFSVFCGVRRHQLTAKPQDAYCRQRIAASCRPEMRLGLTGSQDADGTKEAPRGQLFSNEADFCGPKIVRNSWESPNPLTKTAEAAVIASSVRPPVGPPRQIGSRIGVYAWQQIVSDTTKKAIRPVPPLSKSHLE